LIVGDSNFFNFFSFGSHDTKYGEVTVKPAQSVLKCYMEVPEAIALRDLNPPPDWSAYTLQADLKLVDQILIVHKTNLLLQG